MKLKEYFNELEKLNISPFEFSQIKKIGYNTLKRFLSGDVPALFTGKKIVKATGGKVTLKDLGIKE